MEPFDRREMRWSYLLTILLFFQTTGFINIASTQTMDLGDQLIVSAVGRHARLGYLYDAIHDRFIYSTVFKTTTNPTVAVVSTQRQRKRTQFGIVNTLSDKMKLLNINADQAASILSGLIDIQEVPYDLETRLNDTNLLNGMLVSTYTTVLEDIHLFSKELEQQYNRNVEHKAATHIVTGITWGGKLLLDINMSDEKSLNQSQSQSQNQVESASKFTSKSQLTQIGAALMSDTIDGKKNFIPDLENIISVKLTSDAPLHMFPQPKTLDQLQQIIHEFPTLFENVNEGKGVPLVYTLTPISHLRKHLAISTNDETHIRSIDTIVVQKYIEILENIFTIEAKLIDLETQFQTRPYCVLPQIQIELANLQSNFENSKSLFKTAFRDKLIQFRAGHAGAEDLLEFMETNQAGDFSNERTELVLEPFAIALKKLEFCNSLSTLYPQIQYFGLNKFKLDKEILEVKTNMPLYIFFTKAQFKNDDYEEWQENVDILTHTLYKPYNKLFVIDCDFEFTQCTGVNKSVIKQMKNAVFINHDIRHELQKPLNKVPIEVKAVGRLFKIGDLYKATTASFINKSMFKSAILNTTTSYGQNSKISERNENGEFQLYEVDEETEFSVLTGVKIGNRHFTRQTKCGASDAKIYRYTHSLYTESINNSSPQLGEIIDHDLLNHPEFSATHFVSKIDYGVNIDFVVYTLNDALYTNEDALKYESIFNEIISVASKKLMNLSYTFDELQMYNETLSELTEKSIFAGVISYPKVGQLENLSPIRTIEKLIKYLNYQFLPLLSTTKGRPVSYTLSPIEGLRSDFGIIIPTIKYVTISTLNETTETFARVFKHVKNVKCNIDGLRAKLKSYPDLTTDKDWATMQKVRKEYDRVFGVLRHQFNATVQGIREGEIEVDALPLLRTQLEDIISSSVGGDGRYKIISKMAQYEEKIEFYKQMEGTNIRFLGRNNEKLSFNRIFSEQRENNSEIYLLFYKPEWTVENGKEWRECSGYFFGHLSDNVIGIGRNQSLYVIDCEFDHPHCPNMTGPTIHKYKFGELVAKYPDKEGTNARIDDVLNTTGYQGTITTFANAIPTHSETQEKTYCAVESSCKDFTFDARQSAVSLGLDCGGIIKIPRFPSNGTSFIVEYKINQKYENNEMCLWTLDNTFGTKKYDIQVKVTLLCDGIYDTEDAVSVIPLHVANSMQLSSRILTRASPSTTVNVNGLFIAFVSNDNSPGVGFALRIDLIQTTLEYKGSVLSYKTNQGSISVGPLGNHDRVSVAISPPTQKSTRYTVLYSQGKSHGLCNFFDTLDLFEISAKGTPNRLERLCDEVKSPTSFSTKHPFIALYYTWNTIGNFSISWQ